MKHIGSRSSSRKQFAWPVAGVLLGALVSVNPFYAPQISLRGGIAGWCIAMAAVLILASSPISARVGVLVAGLFLAVPCFVQASPLPRGVLMCVMGLPFVVAAELVFVEPTTGLRARLAHLGNWRGRPATQRRARSFDGTSLFQLAAATTVFAGAIAVVKAASLSASGFGFAQVARWLAGGIGLFAVAEMGTASHDFLTNLMGITVPPLFQSPYRSASVGEFWTRRWNLWASARLFRPCFFQPLARHGVGLAMAATFGVSAVAHALLVYMALGRWGISLVCGAFFLVQPVLIAAERGLAVRRWRPAAGRAWTLAVLALVAPLMVEPALQIVEKSWGAPHNVLQPTLVVLAWVIAFNCVISLASSASRWGTPQKLAMKIIAPIVLAFLLSGCSDPEHVSPAEFKRQYAWVGQAQTVREVSYLGQRQGRAYLKVSSMATLSRKWSEHIIYVELAELDAAFRESLPKTTQSDTVP